jgi:hypothetical protein
LPRRRCGTGLIGMLLFPALLIVTCMQTCPEAEMIDATSTYMLALAGDLEDIFAADASGAEFAILNLATCSRSLICVVKRNETCSSLLLIASSGSDASEQSN